MSEAVLLKLRIFGSAACEDCKMLDKVLKHHNLAYDFIDANNPKHEKLCDFFDINKLPHIQVLNSKTSAVVASHAGWTDPINLLKQAGLIIKAQSEQKTVFNFSKTKNKNDGCRSCYDSVKRR